MSLKLGCYLCGQRKAWHSRVSFLVVAMKANTVEWVVSVEQ